MNNKPVLFLDSGTGGLIYCMDFLNRCPDEAVYYLADRENFPYGPREKDEIAAILVSLTENIIKKIEPKIAVVACNTASLSALDALRKKFPKLPFVGTVPAIKPAALACRSGRIGLLATERTILDIKKLDPENNSCEITGIAAPELVEFIEQRFDETGKKDKEEIAKYYINLFREKGIDTIVLGCTHFLYLLDEFRREGLRGNPDAVVRIFDSLDGITKRIEYLLDENSCALRTEGANLRGRPVNMLMLTGDKPPETVWKNKAKKMGFDLCLLNEVA